MTGIDELRQQVEAEYAATIAALDTVEKYLTKRTAAPDCHPRHRKASKRELVLSAIGDGWATLAEIIARSGLTKVQVNGVLNALDLRASFQRRGSFANREYRYAGPPPLATESNGEVVEAEIEQRKDTEGATQN